MEVLIKASQFLLSISILVILHELGHFIFARLFKTRVEKFYLFFNPWFSLFKVKHKETEYGIGWLPLGGYVKISGMIDESMDLEQMKQPAQPYEFRSKPAWQRLLIMTGGVLVNFLLALVIYSGLLYIWGEEYLPTKNLKFGIAADSVAISTGFRDGDKIISLDGKEIENFHHVVLKIVLDEVKTVTVNRQNELVDIAIPESVHGYMIKNPGFISVRVPFIIDGFENDSSPAKIAGMLPGDRVIKFNGQPTEYYHEIQPMLKDSKGRQAQIGILRGADTLSVDVVISDEGRLGVVMLPPTRIFETKTIEYSLLASIPAGVTKGVRTAGDYLKQFKLFFKPEVKAHESLGGFIKIGSFFPGTWDWYSFWSMTAFLSIILAVLNILPIPALDGGHVLFLFYEIVTGRKPSDKFLEYAQIVGLTLLFALLIFANGNDIVQLFRK